MGTNPNYPAVTLTRNEIAWIVLNDAKAPADLAWIAVAVIWRESRGVSNAFRPESQNPRGGDDRGIVQWNSKAWPNISDDVAYNPRAAIVQMLYVVRTGESGVPDNATGKDRFKHWNVGRYHYGDDEAVISAADEAAAKAAIANPISPVAKLEAAGSRTITDDNTWNPGQAAQDAVTDGAGAVTDAVAGAIPWAGSLATVLGALGDPAWWRRIGIGALGVALVWAAIVLATRSQALTLATGALGARSTGGN